MLPSEQSLTTQIDGALASVSVPGLVVALCDMGGICWSHQRGQRSHSDEPPVTLDSSFNIASVTKTFTATAVLLLRDRGVLRLDDPISDWINEASALRYPTDDSARVTIRHVLTHTSGLPRGVRAVRAQVGRDLTVAELLAELNGMPLEFSPGSDRRYSNLGFALLGIVVSRAAGCDFPQFVSREILDPLGMSDTDWTPDSHNSMALPHCWVNGKWRPGRPKAADSYTPVSGLYSTAQDLARYVAFQLRAWPARDGASQGPVRSATIREAHLVGGWQVPGERMKGLGWGVLDDRRLGHVVYHSGGSPVGYASCVILLPAIGLGLVALANADVDLERTMTDVLTTYAALVLLRQSSASTAVRDMTGVLSECNWSSLDEYIIAGSESERLRRRVREAIEKHGSGAGISGVAPIRLASDGTAYYHLKVGRAVLELTLQPRNEGEYKLAGLRTLSARRLGETEQS